MYVKECWFGVSESCQGPHGDLDKMCDSCGLELKEQQERQEYDCHGDDPPQTCPTCGSIEH